MDGGVAKDVPMVANPRFLLSRLHREGLHGHSFSCAYISPRNPSRFEFGRSVVAACLIMSMLHGRLFAAGLFHGYNYVQLRRKDMFGKVRKTRSDCTVGTYEKKHDLPTGTLRNSDGRKARKDKTLKSLRKETGSDYR
mgnify:CR=1 FL=1